MNFQVEYFFSQIMFLAISRCQKDLVMSTPKPNNFMQLLLAFVGEPVRYICFLHVPEIRMNTLLNLFQINF